MINKKHTRKYDYYLDMYDIFGRFNMFDVYFARINTEVFLKNSKLLYEHELQKNARLAEMLQKNIKKQINGELFSLCNGYIRCKTFYDWRKRYERQ